MNYQRQLLRVVGKKGKKQHRNLQKKRPAAHSNANVEVFANPRLMQLPLDTIREHYSANRKQIECFCDATQYELVFDLLHKGLDPTVKAMHTWIQDNCGDKADRWQRGISGDTRTLRFVQNFANIFPVTAGQLLRALLHLVLVLTKALILVLALALANKQRIALA